MFKTIRKYLKLVDAVLYSALDHLTSWRNILILVTIAFCFKALKTNNAAVVATVFGCWTLIIGFYFHYREKEGGSFNKPTEEDPDEVDPVEAQIKEGKDFGAE